MSIRVYIIKDTKDPIRAQMVGDVFFGDNRFEVIIPNFDLLPDSTPDLESKKVLNVLINAKNAVKDKPIIIVKDTTTSILDTTTLADTIMRIVTDHDTDLLYLARWLDKCELNTKIEDIDTLHLVQTVMPQGIQGILITPSGRDKLIDIIKTSPEPDLNVLMMNSISSGVMNALTTNPTLMNFDITLAKNKLDEAYKTALCIFKHDVDITTIVEPSEQMMDCKCVTEGKEGTGCRCIDVGKGITSCRCIASKGSVTGCKCAFHDSIGQTGKSGRDLNECGCKDNKDGKDCSKEVKTVSNVRDEPNGMVIPKVIQDGDGWQWIFILIILFIVILLITML